ncbi:MAG: phage major capsid protein [Oscillospiraceae bacterium]|nr:phage major capsid protein [Oscillospiraceae bacterium]
MALKALLLRKKLDDAKKRLDALRAKDNEFQSRETELEKAIAEMPEDADEETRSAVEESVTQFEQDKDAHENAKADLNREIEGLEAELEAEEETPAADPVPAQEPVEDKRKDDKNMRIPETRARMFGATAQERELFFAREDVKAYLAEVRNCIKEKRALTNVGLTIPEVMLGVLRENVINYSKLYRHVNVRAISGEGRMIIMGTIPEAVWTDCCANLNELDLAFNDVEVNCWKVGGYFAVCNATLEDSDIDLAAELVSAIGQAIGIALDKAILYGTGTRMPLGVVTRLAQTEAPSGYPATARPWADLHTTNILSVASGTTGANLIAAIVGDFGAAKGKYSRGEKVFVMNEATYTALMAATVSVDASGRIVTGVSDTMPVIGGIIEVLNFVPDNVIIGGYFDLYLLAERAGQKFATSEHVRFLQDQTVFKGTARYDGTPAIAEGFVAIGINGATPTAAMTFAADTANEGA